LSGASAGASKDPNLKEEKLAVRQQEEAELKKLRIREVQEYRLSMDMFCLQDALIEMNTAQEGWIEKGIEAVLAGATLGDLCDLSKDLPPEEERMIPIKAQRGAERFEGLRQWAEDMKQKNEDKLKIFLFNMGPLSQHKARADFATGFFEVGGFELLKNNGFDRVESVVAAAVQSPAEVSVICSTDETYPELVPAIAAQVKAEKGDMKVFVAGRPPKELEEIYRQAGVDGFIYLGANCYGILKALQEEIGNNE
jgi:methylmalonyl-CoA mutase